MLVIFTVLWGWYELLIKARLKFHPVVLLLVDSRYAKVLNPNNLLSSGLVKILI